MLLHQVSDQELIALYIDGKHEAFETLLKRHKKGLFRAIYLKVRDEELANDLFQDTFIKIINTIRNGNYNDEGKFFSWALRIANNLIIDYFRKQNRQKLIQEKPSKNNDFNVFSVIASEDQHALQQLTKDELLGQMVDLVNYLPENQKEIIQLRIFEDMAFKDIAEQLEISINTALGRMRYALLNLRKMIEEHNLVVDI